MLSTTIVHVCARCGSERIRKNGHADDLTAGLKLPPYSHMTLVTKTH